MRCLSPSPTQTSRCVCIACPSRHQATSVETNTKTIQVVESAARSLKILYKAQHSQQRAPLKVCYRRIDSLGPFYC
jgi:hypothetical protein